MPTSCCRKSYKFFQGVVQACQDQDGAKWSEEPTREAIADAMPGFFEREFGMAHRAL